MTGTEIKNKREIPSWVYVAMLVLATVFWGGNFVISKGVVTEIGASWMVGLRFLIAGILMGIVLFPRLRRLITKEMLFAGCVIGLCSFLGYWSQFYGLSGTTPAKNAFLSTCYCITVPFIWWLVARKRPGKRSLLAAAICVTGLGMVTLEHDFSISWGDGMSMLSAVLYGSEIVAVGYFAKDHDPFCLVVIQMIVCGLLGCGLGFVTSGFPSIQTMVQPEIIVAMAYFVLLTSCYGVTVQNVVQRHLPPAQTSMLFALESVFGTIFSAIFWGEILTLQIITGFVLIFIAVLISQLEPSKRQ